MGARWSATYVAHTYLDAHPEAKFDSKVVIVTGPNCGIGYETARVLSGMGMHVVMAGRSADRCNAAIEKIRSDKEWNDKLPVARAERKLSFIPLDLNDLNSVKQFVSKFEESKMPLDYLVNNAGIMAVPSVTRTVQGIERQWGINHVGHFYLTKLLMPQLIARGDARIVCVASAANALSNMGSGSQALVSGTEEEKAAFRSKFRARLLVDEKTYSGTTVYGNSKFSNILHAHALNARYKDQGVHSYSLHPGVVATELGRQAWWAKAIYFTGGLWMKNSDQGASTTLTCLLDGTPGKYHADSLVAGVQASGASEAATPLLANELWELTEELLQEKGFGQQ